MLCCIRRMHVMQHFSSTGLLMQYMAFVNALSSQIYICGIDICRFMHPSCPCHEHDTSGSIAAACIDGHEESSCLASRRPDSRVNGPSLTPPIILRVRPHLQRPFRTVSQILILRPDLAHNNPSCEANLVSESKSEDLQFKNCFQK